MSSLIQAGELCKDAEAKIISMSLGSSFKSSSECSYFAGLVDILPIAAAGNAGSSRKSWPASCPAVVSVAALDANKARASFSQYNDEVDLAAPGVGVISTISNGASSFSATQLDPAGDAITLPSAKIDASVSATVTADMVHCGLGTAACADATGKVCIIQRGDITFCDKTVNCQAGGGIAAVIYNNVDAWPEAWTLSTCAASIPAVGVSKCTYDNLLTSDGSTLVAKNLTVDTNGVSRWALAIMPALKSTMLFNHLPALAGLGRPCLLPAS